MIDRRRLLAVGLAGGALLASARAGASTPMSYDDAVRTTYVPLRTDRGLLEAIRYATLAANSHNTQPWKFRFEPNVIIIAPDFTRRCPAVDPDDHHLFASLGAAAENLVHAAAAMGLAATVAFADEGVRITLASRRPFVSPLFEAIPRRQCTRAPYDGKAANNEALRELEQAGTMPDVAVTLLTDARKIAAVMDYVVEGNTAQMRDKAFMDELQAWMRFNGATAAATMDGLYTAASGNMTLPPWLARRLLPFVFTERGENDKYRAHIASSAGIAVFSAAKNDKAHWVAAGRACQRFALQATASGLKYAFINQPVEVASLRPQFAAWLGLGERRPDLVVRFGAGPELPRSLRRPINQVVAPAPA
jgi:nitroreductase